MLKDSEEWGRECERGLRVKPSMDATLAGDRESYVGFLRRLAGAGLLRLGTKCQVVVTPFFVFKKDDRIRLILDCRPANRSFKEPPSVRLGLVQSGGA